jgi:hypothetical protein
VHNLQAENSAWQNNLPHNPVPQTLSRAANSEETKRQNGMIAAGYSGTSKRNSGAGEGT